MKKIDEQAELLLNKFKEIYEPKNEIIDESILMVYFILLQL